MNKYKFIFQKCDVMTNKMIAAKCDYAEGKTLDDAKKYLIFSYGFDVVQARKEEGFNFLAIYKDNHIIADILLILI